MESIGTHMTDYCKSMDISFQSRKLLISGLKAKKILLSTPLLRWYLKNECIVSKIYQLVEFQPKTAFGSFIDKVTYHRIQGDLNPDHAIIGDTYKLISNAAFGTVLMDRTKHLNVKYLTDKSHVNVMINNANYICNVRKLGSHYL